MTRIELPIDGMTCNHCVGTVAAALERVPGVAHAAVSLVDRRAVVDVADDRTTREMLSAAVAGAGYRVPAEPLEHAPSSAVGPILVQPAPAAFPRRPGRASFDSITCDSGHT